jgi:hypothetical protein
MVVLVVLDNHPTLLVLQFSTLVVAVVAQGSMDQLLSLAVLVAVVLVAIPTQITHSLVQ